MKNMNIIMSITITNIIMMRTIANATTTATTTMAGRNKADP